MVFQSLLPGGFVRALLALVRLDPLQVVHISMPPQIGAVLVLVRALFALEPLYVLFVYVMGPGVVFQVVDQFSFVWTLLTLVPNHVLSSRVVRYGVFF